LEVPAVGVVAVGGLACGGRWRRGETDIGFGVMKRLLALVDVWRVELGELYYLKFMAKLTVGGSVSFLVNMDLMDGVLPRLALWRSADRPPEGEAIRWRGWYWRSDWVTPFLLDAILKRPVSRGMQGERG
jgi:hypothetical protein